MKKYYNLPKYLGNFNKTYNTHNNIVKVKSMEGGTRLEVSSDGLLGQRLFEEYLQSGGSIIGDKIIIVNNHIDILKNHKKILENIFKDKYKKTYEELSEKEKEESKDLVNDYIYTSNQISNYNLLVNEEAKKSVMDIVMESSSTTQEIIDSIKIFDDINIHPNIIEFKNNIRVLEKTYINTIDLINKINKYTNNNGGDILDNFIKNNDKSNKKTLIFFTQNDKIVLVFVIQGNNFYYNVLADFVNENNNKLLNFIATLFIDKEYSIKDNNRFTSLENLICYLINNLK